LDVTAPLSTLECLAKLVSDCESLCRQTEATTVSRTLQAFIKIKYPQEADRLIAQFSWIAAVRKTRLPEQLQSNLLSEPAAVFRKELLDLANRVATASKLESNAWTALSDKFGLERPDAPREAIVQTIEAALEHRAELRDFLASRMETTSLTEHGLAEFGGALEASTIPPERYAETLRHVLIRRRAKAVHRKRPSLQSASGIVLDGDRRTLRTQDTLKIKQDRMAIRRKLLERRGKPGRALGKKKDWTEMALIHHELEKERAFLNVRALLRQAGDSIRALKPCFMMSPMTVSKFLPQDMAFELVIIDEASQMRPEDALGALLRGQIVVVGDAKQLPPTSFFDRAMDDVEIDDDSEEADEQVDESILEACTKSFDRVRRLKWHYRSRCESLISFSNEHFYDRSLITFPMARPGSFAVDLVRVKGTYQAGVNEPEAQRVAEEAISLMEKLAQAENADFGTIAVVAVNQRQREAIMRQFEFASSGNEAVLAYI